MTSRRPSRKPAPAESFHIHINPAIAEQRNKIMNGISMPTLQRSILATGKLPVELSQAVQELAELAAQLMVERTAQAKQLKEQEVKAKTETYETDTPVNDTGCDKYNTYWNAMLQIMGVCTEWDECMYGMKESLDKKWKEVLENYEPGENPWVDCAP